MAKIRKDSWAMQMTQAQQLELYEKAMQPNTSWMQVVKEFGIKQVPSKAAFYRWKNAMRAEELSHRIDAALSSVDEFKDSVSDTKLMALFRSLAAEAALNGDAKTAAEMIRCTAIIHDHQLKHLEYVRQEADRRAEALFMADHKPAFQKLLNATMATLDKPAKDETKEEVTPNAS